ncbi:hypothetical protein AOLI_G00039330 [Acnodon oligacanthus]
MCQERRADGLQWSYVGRPALTRHVHPAADGDKSIPVQRHVARTMAFPAHSCWTRRLFRPRGALKRVMTLHDSSHGRDTDTQDEEHAAPRDDIDDPELETSPLQADLAASGALCKTQER